MTLHYLDTEFPAAAMQPAQHWLDWLACGADPLTLMPTDIETMQFADDSAWIAHELFKAGLALLALFGIGLPLLVWSVK